MGDGGYQDLCVPATDGVRLHVRHRPGTRRPAFLLVHGLASSAREWDDVAGRLTAKGHPAYTIDLRGHGDSDAPDEGYDTATASLDVAAVITALELTGTVLVGHSWGASVALRMAAERPELISGLALVDGGWVDVGGITPQRLTRWRDLLSQLVVGRGETTADAMRAQLRKIHPGWTENAIEAYLADMRVGANGMLTPRLPERHFISILQSVWEDSPHRWYPSITVPAMLLPATRRDAPYGERQWREWVGKAEVALARPIVRWYVDSDHHLQCEQPDRVAKDLLQLAGEIAAASDPA